MPEQRNMIDFVFIWKKIHRMAISEAEDKLLQNWLEEDPKHLMFYEQAQRFYAEGSHFPNDKKLIKSAWKSVQRKTRNNQHKTVQLAAIASSVAASILVMVVLFCHINKNAVPKNLAVNDSVHPGDKVILILNDGSQRSLLPWKSFVLKEGNSIIHSTGEKLEYTQSGKDTNKGEIKYNTLKISRGATFCLRLSDGTRVWLNAESSLRYPVLFTEKERSVELTGEAYFEVAKNEQAPFLVTSGNQVVKVLGTHFNISSYTENKFIYTTLLKGEVEVFQKDNPHNQCILIPNRQSVFSKQDHSVSSHTVDASVFVAWKEGRFVFDNESLENIMQTLSRWYDLKIVFTNPYKKQIRFTGNLKRTVNINGILSKIQKTEEVKFRVNNKTITVE